MAVRPTAANLITRIRVLLNDPSGVSQIFDDQTIQDVMDESREDVVNGSLLPKPTFTGSTVQYLNYYSGIGGWEDDYVLKQFLTNLVTPSTVEPIAGHFQFAATTLPPIYITGKRFDVYRAAADLLERQSARWVLSYDVVVDGQNFRRSQVAIAMQKLAHTYRMQQRAGTISMTRSDLGNAGGESGLSLSPQAIDYMAKG